MKIWTFFKNYVFKHPQTSSVDASCIYLNVPVLSGNPRRYLSETVNIANKIGSDIVTVFSPGSYGEFIGRTESSQIAKHLQNGGERSCTVTAASRTHIEILVRLDAFSKNRPEIVNARRIEELKRPYKPKSPLRASYYSEVKVEMSDVNIQCLSLSEVINNIDNIESCLSIVDAQGNRLNLINRSGIVETIKFIRAINSGVKLQCQGHKRVGYFYQLVFTPVYS